MPPAASSSASLPSPSPSPSPSPAPAPPDDGPPPGSSPGPPPGSSLVSGLTLREKAGLTSGHDTWTTTPAERVGLRALRLSDGPHGLRTQRGTGDSLGLRDSVAATCFPPAVSLGCAWDPELVERVGAALASEARACGVDVVLGPGVNIKRSPLCGRNFEYVSEDPLVAGEFGTAMVRGLQGGGVGASLKHFAANNQETDRLRVSADIDERPLREIYLRAFERVVRSARPWTLMAAYNGINGVTATEHHTLLTRVLREEWGFDGLVMSDWGAVKDRVAALAAGLDLQMPAAGGRTDRQVEQAVAAGRLEEAALDRSVERLAALAARTAGHATGGAEASAAGRDPGDAAAPDVEAHHALAREAAGRGIVLLKNDACADGVPLLPLDRDGGTLAVIGELARTPRYQGGGSSRVNPVRLETGLDAIRAAAGAGAGGAGEAAGVGFAPGYALGTGADAGAGAGAGAEGTGAGSGTGGGTDAGAVAGAVAGLREEAVALAARSRTAVVFLGLPEEEESEGFDRTHIEIPDEQTELLEALAEVNERIVVVLTNGGAVRVTPWEQRVPALVEGWLLGQAGGAAIADVLFGEVNPSGKLTETLPLRLEDTPSYLSFPGEEGHVRYGEGLFVGYRGYDTTDRAVAYPFGHGLSYTTFAYDDLMVDETDDGLRVTVAVTNTGRRTGREVVQLYVRGPAASTVARPVRELRAFGSVTLGPGESGEVGMTLARHELAYYSVREGGWRVEGGDYVVEAAASSRDIRLCAPVHLTADDACAPLTRDSTLGEWRAHTVGAGLLQRVLDEAGDAGTRLTELLADPMILRAAEQMPMYAIAEFPGSPLTEDVLERLLAEIAAGGE
ncbi:glycoside hydrolase family 3 C-terminal domain-containing protein [Streptomyces iconiensis]|uniref:Glycoside hydrolase family 3 C-terminal domain-containing protein n=1 Tax=Streptomyces iconiensis TaxID=1384038 RepID=A0ABT7AA90_9ACTN|nr:glycoside hydrolase family 3 C-terminal domain-containing protein [Streptomyces iconiensis]MDJ1137518.1 glycoside hydrolase family 3 C-terminal domain-containing protein [Streptomyces iconiensis]